MGSKLSVDAELEKVLDALVAAEGGSRQDIIRKAVLDYAQRQDVHAEVEPARREHAEPWGDVFKRLKLS